MLLEILTMWVVRSTVLLTSTLMRFALTMSWLTVKHTTNTADNNANWKLSRRMAVVADEAGFLQKFSKRFLQHYRESLGLVFNQSTWRFPTRVTWQTVVIFKILKTKSKQYILCPVSLYALIIINPIIYNSMCSLRNIHQFRQFPRLRWNFAPKWTFIISNMAGDGDRSRSLKEALYESLIAILSPEQAVRAAGEEQVKALEVTEGVLRSCIAYK